MVQGKETHLLYSLFTPCIHTCVLGAYQECRCHIKVFSGSGANREGGSLHVNAAALLLLLLPHMGQLLLAALLPACTLLSIAILVLRCCGCLPHQHLPWSLPWWRLLLGLRLLLLLLLLLPVLLFLLLLLLLLLGWLLGDVLQRGAGKAGKGWRQAHSG